MIYQLSQVSNRDTHVLYFYRILRHDSSQLGAIYRYDSPEVFVLDKAVSIPSDGRPMYEYHLKVSEVSNRVPYLEFNNPDESDLKGIEDMTEVEVLPDEIIIRGYSSHLANTEVAVYWVPTLAYIARLQAEIESVLGDIDAQAAENADLISRIALNTDYVVNVDGLVPNLVSIGTDDTGFIYDDSKFRLSGSLMSQQLNNPPQDLISGLLKSHTGTLIISDTLGENKVYQGFYGGCIKLSGRFKTLVLKDITSIVFLTAITAASIIIDNCSAVMFRTDLDKEGSSGEVGKVEVRNSYVTVNQPISINSAWCYRNSTMIQKKGQLNRIGFLEAGSTFVYDNPSDDNIIEELHTNPLQGYFYTINPTEEQPYLDELFLAQKPLSFQRGQVEDPLPMSKANVSIYLRHSGNTPTPSPDGKIYSPFTSWYWSGDSRVVQLIAQTHTDGKGYGGQSLPKLREVETEIETEGSQHNIMLWWGVNGLDYGAEAYATEYKAIADAVGNNAKVFAGTVGHCPNGTGSGLVDGGAGQPLGPFNEQIEQFNRDLITALDTVPNVTLIDIASYIKGLEDTHGAAWLTNDNLHYTPAASQAIYDWVCDQITNIEPGVVPEAPTSSNAGIIWNWFRDAGIPNVSNRPELIAGIIGNCQQESFASIDVLGQSGIYCGPWCESNTAFKSYMQNNGFTFHAYSTSAGLQAAPIPYAFTWLTQQHPSWVNWLYNCIDQVQNKTGVEGARAYAELFCVCVERCINGAYSVEDPGVYQIMRNYYGGRVYTYQDLSNRRNNAEAIYRQFMGLS